MWCGEKRLVPHAEETPHFIPPKKKRLQSPPPFPRAPRLLNARVSIPVGRFHHRQTCRYAAPQHARAAQNPIDIRDD